MNLGELRSKPARFIIGLVARNSCAGIDACLVRIKESGRSLSLKFYTHHFLPYTPGLRARLTTPRFDARELGLLNFEMGERFAQAAVDMCNSAKEEQAQPDFIALYGHTLAHVPPRGEGACGLLHLGETAIVAERAKLPVVSDFAARDMALGGQGAPLGAYADWALYHRPDRTTCCVNLGGFTGLTVAPPELEDTLSFHTGPGMLAINGAMRLVSGGSAEADEKGAAAAKGTIVDEFLDYLLEHPYYNRVPPKSTGPFEFGVEAYLRDALTSRGTASLNDLMATVTAAVAYAAIRAFNRFVKPRYDVSRIVLCGEGAENKTLVERLKKGFEDYTVRMSADYGLPPAARDSIAAAVLGNEAVCGVPANIPHATGSSRMAILGKFTPYD